MRWDMDVVWPSLESPEFEAAFTRSATLVAGLRELFDRHDIRYDGTSDLSVAEGVIHAVNELRSHLRTVDAYVYAFVTTDVRDDTARARLSELQLQGVEVAKLNTRFEAWVGSVDLEALIERSPVGREHAFALRKAALAARHQMSEGEEDLAAALRPAGQASWGRLRGDVVALLTAEVGKERLPISKVRSLASDPDPDVRRAAHHAELEAFKGAEVPIAAALNSVKGWTSVLNERRGWPDSLEPALFANNVDRATLEAMQTACEESFPDFRRYLRAKARVLGSRALPWWDLFAPLGRESRTWTYDEAAEFVTDGFATYSDGLAGLARRAFDERWVDVEPREGKVDGAFCMSLRTDESRILLNFSGSFGSVSTAAHELGHAYHNVQLAERTEMQRQTPMALAETASIFCQTIVTNAMLAEASEDERLAILDAELQGSCQIVVDIHSRFLFERAVFEGRSKRELSVSELNEAMLDAQRATYGDGVDPETLHPYMWAAKPHYYGSSFYNWPYTFGMLFGLGLYAQYLDDPDRFRKGYDELLSSTGLADAATLGRRFGIDFSSVGFWRSSLDLIRDRIDAFEALAPGPLD